VSSETAASDACLADLNSQLDRLNEVWARWDRELNEAQRELQDAGMDRLEAAAAMHRRQVDAFRDGTAPLDLDEVHQLLDELCSLYLLAGGDQRERIRESFGDKKRVRKYLHSYIGGRAASRLRDTEDVGWLDLGLAAASIADQRVDYRDLLVSLGKLWMAAEDVGLAPARHFSAVARLSSDQPVYGNRSTRDLLRGFRTSAYLKSIRRREGES
jgi:hypothetical protein